MTSAMAIDLAQRRLNEFQKQCGKYGKAALHLAYHAALSVALNAELLHLLRINFFLDPPEVLPYTVEFEFLLSPLCREIDEGLYEIEPEIRDVLLAGLTQTYDAQRTRDIATLLWQYIDHYSPWADRVELERAQQLTVLNFLNPKKAQQWLATVETEVSRGQAATREWFVAMQEEIENQAQFREINKEKTRIIFELEGVDPKLKSAENLLRRHSTKFAEIASNFALSDISDLPTRRKTIEFQESLDWLRAELENYIERVGLFLVLPDREYLREPMQHRSGFSSDIYIKALNYVKELILDIGLEPEVYQEIEGAVNVLNKILKYK